MRRVTAPTHLRRFRCDTAVMQRIVAFGATVILGLGVLAGVGSPGAASGAVVRAVPPSPIGSFDDVAARFDAPVMSGWAADADALDQPIAVRLYRGTQFLMQVSTGDPRPDVPARMHGVGQNTGWHASLPPGFVPPDAVVCAYAINVGPGENTTLGCRSLAVSGPNPGNPIGVLEVVTATPGLLQLRGWAGDPDTPAPTRLRVYFNGLPATQTHTNLARPDVQSRLGLGPTTGFDLRLPVLPSDAGVTVCVYAENTGFHGTGNSTVGCALRPTREARPPGPHDPVGALDDASPTGAEGWAFDPDTNAPVQVVVRALLMPGVEPLRLVSGPTGSARPDVQAAFPAAGPNRGFDLTLPPPSSPGIVQVTCAYARNAGPGATRLLGCRAPSLGAVAATPARPPG